MTLMFIGESERTPHRVIEKTRRWNSQGCSWSQELPDPLVDGCFASIPFLELSTPIRGPGARPCNPSQPVWCPVMFYMPWPWRMATTCPLIPCVIAYLPVQAVLTLHVFLRKRNSIGNSFHHKDRRNKGKALNAKGAFTRRETAPGARDRNSMVKKNKRKRARHERGAPE